MPGPGAIGAGAEPGNVRANGAYGLQITQMDADGGWRLLATRKAIGHEEETDVRDRTADDADYAEGGEGQQGKAKSQELRANGLSCHLYLLNCGDRL